VDGKAREGIQGVEGEIYKRMIYKRTSVSSTGLR